MKFNTKETGFDLQYNDIKKRLINIVNDGIMSFDKSQDPIGVIQDPLKLVRYFSP